MPTYEFRCPAGHDFDRFYKTISTAPSTLECPECGAMASRQLSAGAGLVFKGSGFYLTDYGKNAHRTPPPDAKGESKTESSKSDAATKAESKGESKSESKPESKPKTETSRAEPAKAKPSTKKPKSE